MVERGRATITDVAREAGVSIATVSRVIGERGSVSPELVERVRAAADHLGYQPSRIARGLATGETSSPEGSLPLRLGSSGTTSPGVESAHDMRWGRSGQPGRGSVRPSRRQSVLAWVHRFRLA